jgi:7-dehydrocholesterol reductase
MNTTQNPDIYQIKKGWGRASTVGFKTLLGCFCIMLFTPLMVVYFYIAAFHFNCSLLAPIQFVASGGLELLSLADFLPSLTLFSFAIFFTWLLFQAILALLPDKLHKIIPSYEGGDKMGAVTPAGNCLPYKINGLQAWVISHLLFIVLSFGLGVFSPTIIFDNVGPFLWVTNLTGFALGIFAYVKALKFPSHADDRKFSGNKFYDFFMGVELNPRVGPIDLKLFFNGRPGIVAWTLINLSFAAAQYAKFGFVTNSMYIVNFLQALYVLYFFWKEAWYLKTIDIHHDHFGWMLAWGDSVWLPFMYTLQALFLVFNPVELSLGYALAVLVIGLIGFYIFADANNQKDRFRKTNGDTLIWGKKPESIDCEYLTDDGVKRKSRLLLSGWWGFTRHMNYTGDLILSLAYSLACGMGYIFPYFYFVFLSILLIHRCLRDEKRCQDKYGAKWDEYCEKVPYRLIPYVW